MAEPAQEGIEAHSGAAILDRLREVTGCPTDAELARRFKISPSSISKWRARDSVPVAQVARIAALSRVNVDYILTGDRKGTVFREIYVVDETIIASILRALNVTGVLGRLKDASEEQAALVLARRIARAYNEIENFAQDLASSHKVPIEEARATALSSFKGLFRAFESVTPDGD